MISHAIELACAFPPSRGLHGACTTIKDLSRNGLFGCDTVFVNSKRAAVALIVQTQMERFQADGHGNRAARRAKKIHA